ncbi:uncharacterized protein N7482_000645 [Penicillium canariense]|uniref:Uncharacterized protein n=1 Tax=Penicillium canariense TaxID=189055 RepID=A0A9W9LS65_9EURO|nr:uncharacterized protein N7482_000645 [Penicillium canariense]KAJ5174768.1 hypothetical protein N7482_000645 [Penicillium canariense]
MSNLMHKVKDVMTGHLHSENKESGQDSSKMENRAEDVRDSYGSSNTGTQDYGSSNLNPSAIGSESYGPSGGNGSRARHESKMGNKMEGTGNAYGSTTTGTGNYGSGGYDSKMGNTMSSGETYGPTTTGSSSYGSRGSGSEPRNTYGSTGAGMPNYGFDAHPDSKRGQGDTGLGGYGGTQDDSRKGHSDYGASTMDSDAFGSKARTGDLGTESSGFGSTGGYGSGNMNAGLHDSNMASKTEPRAESNLGKEIIISNQIQERYSLPASDDRGTYGGDPTSNVASTGQTGGYGSNYGTTGSNAMDSGTKVHNTRSSNVAKQMENRADPEIENRGGLQGFGGATAGGSSYDAPESTGRRRSSGPHSFNLLNKLDPRVHSSDYDSNAAPNQRGQ